MARNRQRGSIREMKWKGNANGIAPINRNSIIIIGRNCLTRVVLVTVTFDFLPTRKRGWKVSNYRRFVQFQIEAIEDQRYCISNVSNNKDKLCGYVIDQIGKSWEIVEACLEDEWKYVCVYIVANVQWILTVVVRW